MQVSDYILYIVGIFQKIGWEEGDWPLGTWANR